MKKFIALVTVFAMLASMMTFLATGVTAADDVPADAITIGNASDFASIFSAADQKTPRYYVLTANIDLKEIDAFHTDPGTHYFKMMEGSTLDGNGYTITANNANLSGMFEILQDADTATNAKTTFKNINFGSADAYEPIRMGVFLFSQKVDEENGIFEEDTYNLNLNVDFENIKVYAQFKNANTFNNGVMLCGDTHGTYSFNNCHVYVSVADATQGYGNQTGGFIGRLNNGSASFNECSVNGTIVANNSAAGFIGKCQGAVSFTDCVNNADVHDLSASSGISAGYIADCNASGVVIKIENCVNNGDIGSATGNKAGGFVGDGRGSGTANVTIKNALNTGTVMSADGKNAAGIVFKVATATLENCINIGALVGNVWGGGSTVGGIATGGTDKLNMTNCYSFGPIYKITEYGTDAEKIWGYAPIAASGGAKIGTMSGNKYIAFTPAEGTSGAAVEKLDTSATTVATLAEAIELLEATSFGATMNFVTNGDAIVVEKVALEGIQMNKDKDAIRLLAAINSLDYATAGFEYSIKINGKEEPFAGTKAVTKAYGSVLASTEEGYETITADDLGGNYIVALVIKNVQAGDVITITLVAGETRSNTVTITVGENGQLSW